MDEVRKEAKAQKESESEGIDGDDEAQKDIVMADAGEIPLEATPNGKEATFDNRDKSASQTSAPSSRQKYTGKSQRKKGLR